MKDEILPYNQWDFAVVLNMIYSDNYNLMKKWFPEDSEEQMMDKMVDLAVNWLRDDDNPYGKCKAWGTSITNVYFVENSIIPKIYKRKLSEEENAGLY